MSKFDEFIDRAFNAIAGLAIFSLVLILAATFGGLLGKLINWTFSAGF